MVSLVEPGFAIRRMSRCLGGLEVDCGSTGFDGFHACCPSSLICPGPQYNAICCPAGDSSCTEKTLAAKIDPPCANATWDLFDNGGYYCCDPGLQAFNRSNTNWCGRPSGVSSTVVVNELSLLRAGVDPATVVPSSSSSPASSTPAASSAVAASGDPPSLTSPTPSFASPTTSAATSEPSASQSSFTPVGAIAGGVIGGVAALSLLVFLTWFFLRRRRQREHTPELHGDPHIAHEKHGDSHLAHEAYGSEKYASTNASGVVHEAPENASRMPAAELAGDQRPVELDGTGRVR